ncbi:MAG: hypothetical protein ACO397_05025 [Gammaproteobacteria bacterium]|jgi:polyhydroxyalkanoate synthesis regulator phasin
MNGPLLKFLESLKDKSKTISDGLPSEKDLLILFELLHEQLKNKTDGFLAAKGYVAEKEIAKLEKTIERLESRLADLESKLR